METTIPALSPAERTGEGDGVDEGLPFELAGDVGLSWLDVVEGAVVEAMIKLERPGQESSGAGLHTCGTSGAYCRCGGIYNQFGAQVRKRREPGANIPAVLTANGIPPNAVWRASTVVEFWPHAKESSVDEAPKLNERA